MHVYMPMYMYAFMLASTHYACMFAYKYRYIFGCLYCFMEILFFKLAISTSGNHLGQLQIIISTIVHDHCSDTQSRASWVYVE